MFCKVDPYWIRDVLELDTFCSTLGTDHFGLKIAGTDLLILSIKFADNFFFHKKIYPPYESIH
jgi:hypothetical protein